METYNEIKNGVSNLWTDKSGLIDFLSRVQAEVKKFEEATEFGIEHAARLPDVIDGSSGIIDKVGFVVTRNNRLIAERTYCLYSVLRDGVLHGYIGLNHDGRIDTVRELKPIKDYRRGPRELYDWLRELIKYSCSK
jgi:hypothetical protein